MAFGVLTGLAAAQPLLRCTLSVPDALAAVQAEVAKGCKSAVYGEDFADTVDFNNDRLPDAIFNLGAVNCDGVPGGLLGDAQVAREIRQQTHRREFARADGERRFGGRFSASRRLYAVASGLHAWLEWPVLLALLAGPGALSTWPSASPPTES